MSWKEFLVILLALIAYDLIVKKVVMRSLDHFESAFEE